LVAAKECSINKFKGNNDSLLYENVKAFDSEMKDLLIQVLLTIPHEKERTSNCKPICDISIISETGIGVVITALDALKKDDNTQNNN